MHVCSSNVIWLNLNPLHAYIKFQHCSRAAQYKLPLYITIISYIKTRRKTINLGCNPSTRKFEFQHPYSITETQKHGTRLPKIWNPDIRNPKPYGYQKPQAHVPETRHSATRNPKLRYPKSRNFILNLDIRNPGIHFCTLLFCRVSLFCELDIVGYSCLKNTIKQYLVWRTWCLRIRYIRI